MGGFKFHVSEDLNVHSHCTLAKATANKIPYSRWATGHASLSIIKLLRQFGGKPSGNILLYALDRADDHANIVNFLLENGANIDPVPYRYDHGARGLFYDFGSALNFACSNSLIPDEVVQILLEWGASLAVKDRNGTGDNCLDIVMKEGTEGKKRIVEVFLRDKNTIRSIGNYHSE